MIKELKLQLNRFIDSCDNELLITEARELLLCKEWWSDTLNSPDQPFHIVRTEKIFVEYLENKSFVRNS